MTNEDIRKLFTYAPNTPEQDAALEKVYEAAQNLALAISKHVPQKHANQGLMQLAGLITLCRQGVEVEVVEEKPMLVRM
jgi:hypothetical protein